MSSFLSAFNKAKDSTKSFVQNSSAKISHRLQINLTASPPNSPKLSPVDRKINTFPNDEKLESQSEIEFHLVAPQSKVYNVTKSSVIAPNPVIKFSEPLVFDCNSENFSLNAPSNEEKCLNLIKTNIDIDKKEMSPGLAVEHLDQVLSKIDMTSEIYKFENKISANGKCKNISSEKNYANDIDNSIVSIDINQCPSSNSNHACNKVVDDLYGDDISNGLVENSESNDINFSPDIYHVCKDNLESLGAIKENNFEVNCSQSLKPSVISLSGNLTSVSDSLSKHANSHQIVDPRKKCVFCFKENHESHNCTKFNDNKLFWSKVYLERRCKNCLRQFHFSNSCFDRSFCKLRFCQRKDKHSPVLCKYRYQYFQQDYVSKRPQYFQGQFQYYSQYSRGNEYSRRKYQKYKPQNIVLKGLISQSSQTNDNFQPKVFFSQGSQTEENFQPKEFFSQATQTSSSMIGADSIYLKNELDSHINFDNVVEKVCISVNNENNSIYPIKDKLFSNSKVCSGNCSLPSCQENLLVSETTPNSTSDLSTQSEFNTFPNNFISNNPPVPSVNSIIWSTNNSLNSVQTNFQPTVVNSGVSQNYTYDPDTSLRSIIL